MIAGSKKTLSVSAGAIGRLSVRNKITIGTAALGGGAVVAATAFMGEAVDTALVGETVASLALVGETVAAFMGRGEAATDTGKNAS